MISFIKRKKKLCKPGPMLNHELTVINHIFWKDESNFSDRSQAWVLPD